MLACTERTTVKPPRAEEARDVECSQIAARALEGAERYGARYNSRRLGYHRRPERIYRAVHHLRAYHLPRAGRQINARPTVRALRRASPFAVCSSVQPPNAARVANGDI